MEKLIGKCGFYCGACPTYLAGNCLGCMDEHSEIFDVAFYKMHLDSLQSSGL